MFIKNAHKKDSFVPCRNDILDKIMVRANDRCVSFDEEIECKILDKITLKYNIYNGKLYERPSFSASFETIKSRNIIIPEVKFEDIRKQQIDERLSSGSHLSYISKEIEELDKSDPEIDLDMLLINLVAYDMDWAGHGMRCDVAPNKDNLLVAAHLLRRNHSKCIKNIVCNLNLSSYNELLKCVEEDNREISRFNMKLHPKHDYGDSIYYPYRYDDIVFVTPKKSQFGSFYLFNKKTGLKVDYFLGKYTSLIDTMSLGVCFFDNFSCAPIGVLYR